jgi:ribosomal protein S18 acetylase RimI-like enzyme
MKIVDGTNHLDAIKALIVEYTQSLQRDLTFQGLAEELACLERKYAPPAGRLLAAVTEEGHVAGCVAYHRHTNTRCEMKRLYVQPAYRCEHTGQVLIAAIIEAARQDGYTEMVLDTLCPMQRAIYLYKQFGFEEIDAYYDNPMKDVLYMRKVL